MTEQWKKTEEFGPFYEVSNLGRFRSLSHYFFSKLIGKEVLRKGRIIKHTLDGCGYPQVTIKVDGKKVTKAIHRLVFAAFGRAYDSKVVQIDHIDNCKTNNCINNLQLISARENSSKRSLNLKKTSAYTGVSWSNERKKWQSHIRINGKTKSLGRYDDEMQAAEAYRNALMTL